MSANRINKTEVYDFLIKKENEVINEVVNPLVEKAKEEKEKYIKQLLAKHDLKKLRKDSNELGIRWSNIRDELNYSYGTISTLANNLNFKDEESILNSIKNCINWKNIESVSKAFIKSSDARSEIKTEYRKLNAMVKDCSTGNKAVRILKEIGFDTSSIKPPEAKNEVLALNVNKKALGIK